MAPAPTTTVRAMTPDETSPPTPLRRRAPGAGARRRGPPLPGRDPHGAAGRRRDRLRGRGDREVAGLRGGRGAGARPDGRRVPGGRRAGTGGAGRAGGDPGRREGRPRDDGVRDRGRPAVRPPHPDPGPRGPGILDHAVVWAAAGTRTRSSRWTRRRWSRRRAAPWWTSGSRRRDPARHVRGPGRGRHARRLERPRAPHQGPTALLHADRGRRGADRPGPRPLRPFRRRGRGRT